MFLAMFCHLLILQPRVVVKGFNSDLNHREVGEVADDENFIEEAIGTMSDWIFGSDDDEESPNNFTRETTNLVYSSMGNSGVVEGSQTMTNGNSLVIKNVVNTVHTKSRL